MAMPAAPTARVSRNSRRVTNVFLHGTSTCSGWLEFVVDCGTLNCLKGAGIFESLLHARPTNTRRFFRCCCAVPVSFKADCFAIADLVKSAELSCPVNESGADGCPVDFAVCILYGVLNVAVMNAILGQRLPRSREGVKFAAHNGVGRVPVERQVRRLNCVEDSCSFAAGGRVALELILQNEKNVLLAGDLRSRTKLLVDSCAIWSNIVQTPEVEAAHFAGIELLRQ